MCIRDRTRRTSRTTKTTKTELMNRDNHEYDSDFRFLVSIFMLARPHPSHLLVFPSSQQLKTEYELTAKLTNTERKASAGERHCDHFDSKSTRHSLGKVAGRASKLCMRHLPMRPLLLLLLMWIPQSRFRRLREGSRRVLPALLGVARPDW